MRVGNVRRLRRGNVLVGETIGQGLKECPIQETLGRASGSSFVEMLALAWQLFVCESVLHDA